MERPSRRQTSRRHELPRHAAATHTAHAAPAGSWLRCASTLVALEPGPAAPALEACAHGALGRRGAEIHEMGRSDACSS